MRVEVLHQDKPNEKVLVAIADDATLDDLHSAIEKRLGLRPTCICLGETNAQILSIYDIRDGDSLRVVKPRFTSSSAPSASPEQERSHDAPQGRPPQLRVLLKLLLTLLIFVILERSFQRWVYLPFFHPLLEAAENREYVEGVRTPAR